MTQTLADALSAVYEKDLGSAINILRTLLPAQGTPSHRERLETIAGDYSRMKDFMLRGFADPQREELYMNCLRRTYSLIQDVELHWLCLNRSVFANARQASAGLNLSHDFIRTVLEGFVSDVAMLSLSENDGIGSTASDLYERHYTFLDRLFSALLVSPQWSESDARFFKELFLSPTIDSSDAAYLVSAVFLSNLHLFDYNKYWLLNQLYTYSTSTTLRQRALVGWALSMPTRQQTLFPALAQMMAMATDELQCEELAELQKQIFLCMNAEKDHKLLERDVFPTIIKNNNLRIDRFGITEKEDDPLQDILHPDAGDKAMEEVERSIKRMIDMERSGADIYFGGFSRMKGFSFFSSLPHWFCPFSANHPSLKPLLAKNLGSRFIDNIMMGGALCDSDKYSLCFGMAQIVDRMPANLREMIGSADSIGPMVPDERRNSPAYIRRMYLQDLYRFFNIYERRSELRNPFARDKKTASAKPALFFANANLSRTMSQKQTLDVASFLYSQDHHSLCHLLLQSTDNRNSFPPAYYLLMAMLATEQNHLPQARQYYQQVLALEPENQKALKGLARLWLIGSDFEKAVELYKQLNALNPSSTVVAANLGIALTGCNRSAEAVKMLYQYYYDYPDDVRIRRVLAWALLNDGSFAEAQKHYTQLIEGPQALPADSLNSGYCHWFMGDLAKAADSFGRFVMLSKESGDGQTDAPATTLEQEMQGDSTMLLRHGISETDQKIMCNIVRDGL